MAPEILEDVNDECNKFGKVLEIKIPRPSDPESTQGPGIGKIFVKFSDEKSATGALKALAGRKFSDRTVVTTYFSEVSQTRASILQPSLPFSLLLTMHRKTSRLMPGSGNIMRGRFPLMSVFPTNLLMVQSALKFLLFMLFPPSFHISDLCLHYPQFLG